jgi:hypothetical protein
VAVRHFVDVTPHTHIFCETLHLGIIKMKRTLEKSTTVPASVLGVVVIPVPLSTSAHVYLEQSQRVR